MAGVRARFSVPRAALMERRPSTSVSIPASTGNTSAPAARAMQQTLDRPESIFPATTAVTELSV